MSNLEFSLPEVDFLRAQEGVKRYASGVEFLHDPVITQTYHKIDVYNEPEELVYAASNLIIEGLKQAIRFSNPPEKRNSLKEMEGNFLYALSNLAVVRETAYGSRSDLMRHFPALALYRPFPVLYESIYKRVCHGNAGTAKLPLRVLTDSVAVSPLVREQIRHPDENWEGLRKHADELRFEPAELSFDSHFFEQ